MARLAVGINTLHSTCENYSAAAARIQDTDLIHESAQLARHRILQQSALAILSQVNREPELALTLLT